MDIVLYSSGCPKCKVLEGKLKDKSIEYTTSTDFETVINKGFNEAPVLYVDGMYYGFKEACNWVNNKEVKNAKGVDHEHST